MDTRRDRRSTIRNAAPGVLLAALLAAPALLTPEASAGADGTGVLHVRQAFRAVTALIRAPRPARLPAPTVTTGTRG